MSGTIFPAISSPVIAGYTADLLIVAPTDTITGDFADKEYLVTYKRNTERQLPSTLGGSNTTSSDRQLPKTGEKTNYWRYGSLGMLICGGTILQIMRKKKKHG